MVTKGGGFIFLILLSALQLGHVETARAQASAECRILRSSDAGQQAPAVRRAVRNWERVRVFLELERRSERFLAEGYIPRPTIYDTYCRIGFDVQLGWVFRCGYAHYMCRAVD